MTVRRSFCWLRIAAATPIFAGLLPKDGVRSEKGESAVGWDEVCAHAAGMIALWGGEMMSVIPVKTGIQAVSSGQEDNLDSGFRRNDGESQDC